MLRILIADDHEIVRRGVRMVVENQPGWEVCAETADGEAALDLALQLRPDVAVLAVALRRLDGVAVTRRLRAQVPDVRVLLFTSNDDYETVANGLAAGARGFVLKSDSAGNLEAAISALGANRPYFSWQVSEQILDAATNERGAKSFTQRELEVAQLIAEGHTNKEIAGLLSLSTKTVESHRSAALRKSGSCTSAGFVRFVIKQHLITA
ncbi:MAG TPA: response regulator transcription factor [Caulobacteraceae bacterium]